MINTLTNVTMVMNIHVYGTRAHILVLLQYDTWKLSSFDAPGLWSLCCWSNVTWLLCLVAPNLKGRPRKKKTLKRECSQDSDSYEDGSDTSSLASTSQAPSSTLSRVGSWQLHLFIFKCRSYLKFKECPRSCILSEFQSNGHSSHDEWWIFMRLHRFLMMEWIINEVIVFLEWLRKSVG